jgi:ABC-2 type transport system ATP-binding protein
MATIAVEVDGLVKRYPKNPVPAVDGVSFTVERGEVFGFLGPNGAGKTTTIGVLTTRVRPSAGRALVTGIDVVADPVAARRHFAVVPQRNNLDRSLSIRQNLLFHAAYHGMGRADRVARAQELLEQFGLADRADDRVDMFSGGQMQRVMIARALMHAPDVLFLDEPTTGLDPAARLFVWDRVRELRAGGVTIVLTTHAMDEAAQLSDRVAIMDHGHLLALDTPDALTRSLPGSSTLEIAVTARDASSGDLVGALGRLDGVERAETVDEGATVPGGAQTAPGAGAWPGGGGGAPGQDAAGAVRAGTAELRIRLYLSADAAGMVAPVAGLLGEQGATLTDVRLGTPSLEDVFIGLTGRSLR